MKRKTVQWESMLNSVLVLLFYTLHLLVNQWDYHDSFPNDDFVHITVNIVDGALWWTHCCLLNDPCPEPSSRSWVTVTQQQPKNVSSIPTSSANNFFISLLRRDFMAKSKMMESGTLNDDTYSMLIYETDTFVSGLNSTKRFISLSLKSCTNNKW